MYNSLFWFRIYCRGRLRIFVSSSGYLDSEDKIYIGWHFRGNVVLAYWWVDGNVNLIHGLTDYRSETELPNTFSNTQWNVPTLIMYQTLLLLWLRFLLYIHSKCGKCFLNLLVLESPNMSEYFSSLPRIDLFLFLNLYSKLQSPATAWPHFKNFTTVVHSFKDP